MKNLFLRDCITILIITMIGVYYVFNVGIPVSLLGKDITEPMKVLFPTLGIAYIIKIFQQWKIYKEVQSSSKGIEYLFRLIFKHSPEVYIQINEDDEVEAQELVKLSSYGMEQMIHAYLGTDFDLQKVCRHLQWKHIIRWQNFKAASFMMSFLLITTAISAQAPKLEVSPFFGGTALVLTDITDEGLDIETGITAGVEGIINFKSDLYASVGTGYDSHDFNDRSSFKGSFIEVGVGSNIHMEGPWQISSGIFWKSSFSKGQTIQQYGVKPSIWWKDFFIKVQLNFYEYQELVHFGGTTVAGIRIPLIRNNKESGQTNPDFYSR